jgi:hypothetical protein
MPLLLSMVGMDAEMTRFRSSHQDRTVARSGPTFHRLRDQKSELAIFEMSADDLALGGLRFHDPCIVAKASPRYWVGRVLRSANTSCIDAACAV